MYMIFFGAKKREIAKETVIDRCPNCRSQTGIGIHVFQTYGHICWLPIFPTNKTVESVCTNCQEVLEFDEMPNSFKIASSNLKAQSRTPLWTFSGWAVAALIAVAYFYMEKERASNTAKYILMPKSGDIYEVKTEGAKYTLYKIDEVAGDSVFVRYNNYETDDESGIDALKSKGDTAYELEVAGYLKPELRRMYDNGEILNISRR